MSQGLPVPIEELWPRIEDLLEGAEAVRWSRFERDAAGCLQRRKRAIADAYGHGYRLHEIAALWISLSYSEPQIKHRAHEIEQCGFTRPGPRQLRLPFMS